MPLDLKGFNSLTYFIYFNSLLYIGGSAGNERGVGKEPLCDCLDIELTVGLSESLGCLIKTQNRIKSLTILRVGAVMSLHRYFALTLPSVRVDDTLGSRIWALSITRNQYLGIISRV
jgi:hypothetical protein